jgi:hypothetical protein
MKVEMQSETVSMMVFFFCNDKLKYPRVWLWKVPLAARENTI